MINKLCLFFEFDIFNFEFLIETAPAALCLRCSSIFLVEP
jgi:hypothetical protein